MFGIFRNNQEELHSSEDEKMTEEKKYAVTAPAQQIHFTFEPFVRNTIRWSQWVERFETALDIFGCVTGKRKMFLLHYMGSQTYVILSNKVAPLKPSEMTYDDIVKILGDHFEPKANEILERYRLNLRKQKEDESCAEYLVVLRSLAINCNFQNYLDSALRDRFVFGLRNGKIQNRLLEEKELTLGKALNIANAFETAEKGGVELQREAEREYSLNAVRDKMKAQQKGNIAKHIQKEPRSKQQQCYRCGSASHVATACKHTDTVCNFCNLKGHLRKVCMKEKRQQMNQIDAETNNEQSLELPVEEMCPIFEEKFHQIDTKSTTSIRSKIFHNLLVNDININFEIDTGAPVTVVGLADAKRYFSREKVKTSDTNLISYSGHQLECLGYIMVTVTTQIKNDPVKLYIVRAHRQPLLGREWMRLIKLDWAKVYNQ